MSVFLALFQLTAIIAICIYEYKKTSPIVFMWATVLLMFGLPHFFGVVSGFDEYSSYVLDYASVFVLFFCIIYVTTRIGLSSLKKTKGLKFKNSSFEEYYEKKLNFSSNKIYKSKFILLCIILLLVALITELISMISIAGGLLNTSISTRQDFASERSYINFSTVLGIFIQIGYSILILSLIEKKYVLFITISALVVIFSIVTRSRAQLVYLFIALIIYLLFRDTKINTKKVVIVLLLGTIAIYSIEALRVFRHYGSISAFIENSNFYEFNSRMISYFVADNTEMGLRKVFYYFIENNNEFTNFGEGHTYLRLLMVLVPTRFSFGLKPPDFAISMGAAHVPGSVGHSTHPTLFGDCYANFGFLGIFLGIFWAFIGCLFDLLISRLINIKNKVMAISVFFIIGNAFVIIGRGSVYNAFADLIRCLIVLYIIHIVLKFIINTNAENKKLISENR